MRQTARNQRRAPRFSEFTEVLAEVRRVEASHRTVGRWSLAQICKHLADSFNGSIDGLDLTRHRFKRFFFARQLLRYTFRHGIPAGYTVDPNLTPPPDTDLGQAIDEFSRAIQRYIRHRGSLRAHPLFGCMPRDTWDRLHCFHCAHHLSFVVLSPRGDPTGSPSDGRLRYMAPPAPRT